MAIHPGHLREYVIRPTLKHMGHYSEAAVELLMLTAAQESLLGRYLHQVGGPALGIYQMEPRTHDDIWENWLRYKAVAGTIESMGKAARDLPGNLYYATAMARCHYLRVPDPLPNPVSVEAMALYWKKHYNTPAGAGQPHEAIRNYRDLAGDD